MTLRRIGSGQSYKCYWSERKGKERNSTISQDLPPASTSVYGTECPTSHLEFTIPASFYTVTLPIDFPFDLQKKGINKNFPNLFILLSISSIRDQDFNFSSNLSHRNVFRAAIIDLSQQFLLNLTVDSRLHPINTSRRI